MFEINEILWGRLRGYPWWPGQVVSPTPAQLKLLSIDKVPPDHRVVWFFNDNNNYNLIKIKDLRPFPDHDIPATTKQKKGKNAARLKQAYVEALAAYESPSNIEEEAVDAVVIHPSTAVRDTASAGQHRKSKKRKNSNLDSSPQLDAHPSNEMTSSKRRRETMLDRVACSGSKTERVKVSQRNQESTTHRPPGEADSDKLSTHCNPSPCDRSSQETGVDSSTNGAAAKDTAPHITALRLRIRKKHSSMNGVERDESGQPEAPVVKQRTMEHSERINSREGKHRKKEGRLYELVRNKSHEQYGQGRTDETGSNKDVNSRRDEAANALIFEQRNASHLPPKLRHSSGHKSRGASRQRRLTGPDGSTTRDKVGSTGPRSERPGVETADIESDVEEVKPTGTKWRAVEQQVNADVAGFGQFGEPEESNQFDLPVRRSGRMRRMSSKMARMEDGSGGESKDDDQRPVASKRSRGAEAPRMSHGQRRLHIRDKVDSKPVADAEDDGEDEKRAVGISGYAPKDKASGNAMDEAANPFQKLSKDECIQLIMKLQHNERRKSVELWLRGRRLAKGQGVLQTEEDLIKTCESGVEKAEELLTWAKAHEGYSKEVGSRFAKMERKVYENCKVLSNVYFNRGGVSLKKVGNRILKVAKELSPHTRRVSGVLRDMLVLWVDLTEGFSKKRASTKMKTKSVKPKH